MLSISKTRLVLVLATVLTLGNTRAAGPAKGVLSCDEGFGSAAIAVPVEMERELDRQINKYVTYPLLERKHQMDGEVLVSFVIDTEGKVNVIQAHSQNTALCEYVLRMLAKVDIGSNPDGLWKTTRMRFNFRPEV
jgi:Gram-negative bacterial TonB protein C-terminal